MSHESGKDQLVTNDIKSPRPAQLQSAQLWSHQALGVRNQHDKRARQACALYRCKTIDNLVVTGISMGNDRFVNTPTLARQKEPLAAAVIRSDASDDQTALLEAREWRD